MAELPKDVIIAITIGATATIMGAIILGALSTITMTVYKWLRSLFNISNTNDTVKKFEPEIDELQTAQKATSTTTRDLNEELHAWTDFLKASVAQIQSTQTTTASQIQAIQITQTTMASQIQAVQAQTSKIDNLQTTLSNLTSKIDNLEQGPHKTEEKIRAFPKSARQPRTIAAGYSQ